MTRGTLDNEFVSVPLFLCVEGETATLGCCPVACTSTSWYPHIVPRTLAGAHCSFIAFTQQILSACSPN
jgi:hypothetical protein